MTGPLDGLLVLEVGDGISAAYCTQIMGVLGADVVKVEPPAGDSSRRMGPFPDGLPDSESSGLYLYLNRNKRSVTLDLDTPTGQDVFRSLASRAGMIVENFPPGYLPARGLGYDALSSEHADLVMTSITPFGQDGPYRDYRGSEMTLFAIGGIMTIVGDIEREPLKFGGHPILHLAGLYGFSSALVALYLAEETGIGQHVDVSVFESLGASHFQDVSDYIYHGGIRNRGELRTPIPVQDGYISFSAQAHQFPDLQRLILGREADAGSDPGDVLARDREGREGDIDTEILMWSYDKTKLDAYRLVQEAHVPAAYLADMKDVLESPQYAARGYFHEIEHPRVGRLTYPGFPAKMSGVEFRFARAPLLGEHNEEVLTSLGGLSEEEIAEVAAAGVL